ncbi:MAG: WG repeat-containing protein [Ruminococcaceae bacterium]|nr:WG repeat-containing protein [Oscillospiraceae bacterium]
MNGKWKLALASGLLALIMALAACGENDSRDDRDDEEETRKSKVTSVKDDEDEEATGETEIGSENDSEETKGSFWDRFEEETTRSLSEMEVCTYDVQSIGSFHNGLAKVDYEVRESYGYGSWISTKSMFIDIDGNVVISGDRFSNLPQTWENKVARLIDEQNNSQACIVNNKGEVLVSMSDPGVYFIGYVYNDMYYVITAEELLSGNVYTITYYDGTGAEICKFENLTEYDSDFRYGDVSTFFDEYGFMQVYLNDENVLVKNDGTILTAGAYDYKYKPGEYYGIATREEQIRGNVYTLSYYKMDGTLVKTLENLYSYTFEEVEQYEEHGYSALTLNYWVDNNDFTTGDNGYLMDGEGNLHTIDCSAIVSAFENYYNVTVSNVRYIFSTGYYDDDYQIRVFFTYGDGWTDSGYYNFDINTLKALPSGDGWEEETEAPSIPEFAGAESIYTRWSEDGQYASVVLRSKDDVSFYAIMDAERNVLMGPTKNIVLTDSTYSYVDDDDLFQIGADIANLCLAKDATTGRYGYIDVNGNWVIPANFSQIGAFENDLAPAMDPTTNLWGYINASGEWVLQPKYNSALSFSEGYATVDNVKVIDTKGDVVIDCSSKSSSN